MDKQNNKIIPLLYLNLFLFTISLLSNMGDNLSKQDADIFSIIVFMPCFYFNVKFSFDTIPINPDDDYVTWHDKWDKRFMLSIISGILLTGLSIYWGGYVGRKLWN